MYEELFIKAKKISANELERNLAEMNYSGLYALKVKDINSINEGLETIQKLSELVLERGHNVLYLGKTKTKIAQRLLAELRALLPGTFFRSTGAVLGKLPIRGCLIGRANTNYRFKNEDKAEIIDWINENLNIEWIEMDENIEITETELIQELMPPFNIQHNGENAFRYLLEKRAECIAYARLLP